MPPKKAPKKEEDSPAKKGGSSKAGFVRMEIAKGNLKKQGGKIVPATKAPTPAKKQSKIVDILLALPKVTNSRKGAEALAKKLPAFKLRPGTGNNSSGNYFYTERRINGQQYTLNLREIASAQRQAKTNPEMDDTFLDKENVMRLNRMLKFKLKPNKDDVVNPIVYPSKEEEDQPFKKAKSAPKPKAKPVPKPEKKKFKFVVKEKPKPATPSFPPWSTVEISDEGQSIPDANAPSIQGVQARKANAIRNINKNDLSRIKSMIADLTKKGFSRTLTEDDRLEKLRERQKKFEKQIDWYEKHYEAWNDSQNIPEPLKESNLTKLKLFLEKNLKNPEKYDKPQVREMKKVDKFAQRLTDKTTNFSQRDFERFYRDVRTLMEVLKVNPLTNKPTN